MGAVRAAAYRRQGEILMERDERLAKLLRQWQVAHDGGREVPLEALCRDCPELLEPLRQKIEQLQKIDALFPPASGSTALQTPDPQSLPSASPGRQLGKFQILASLGTGAFGAVYLARDTELD